MEGLRTEDEGQQLVRFCLGGSSGPPAETEKSLLVVLEVKEPKTSNPASLEGQSGPTRQKLDFVSS